MVTVLRAHGLRVVIFSNDHQPAHVHVFGDGQAKVNLLGAEGAPELIWADAMSRGEIRRAMPPCDRAAGFSAGSLEGPP
jgi:hypothetical protein